MRYLSAIALLLAVLGIGGALYYRGTAADEGARADAQQSRADTLVLNLAASEAARDKEHASAIKAERIAAIYEQDKIHAQQNADQLAADLRSQRVRLRNVWTCPDVASVPAPSHTAAEPDAAANDRTDSAARIVGAADRCDAQVKGLQNFIRAERE